MAVAEVALGRRAGGHDRAGLGHQRDVAVAHVDPVHDRRALAEEPGAFQQLDRRAAVLGLALLQLARLLVRVDVADEPVRFGVARDLAQPVRRHRPHAVGGDSDRVAGQPQRVDAGEVVVDRGVAEARVPAAVIGRGQQDDGQSRSGAGDGERHRVRLLVRRAVGPVVDVVELADGAVAGGGHLGVDVAGDLAHRFRLERLGQPVHLLAPAPEVVVRPLAALADAPQVALEGVRVHVGHRRDPHRASSCGGGQKAVGGDRGVVERDLLLGRVADAGVVAHQHHPRGTGGGDHARVVAGVADQPRLRRPQARQQRVAHAVRELGARTTTRRSAARARRPRPSPPARSRAPPSRAMTRRSPARAHAHRATGARARARWSASSARPPCGRR